jgi:hypothetical protein
LTVKAANSVKTRGLYESDLQGTEACESAWQLTDQHCLMVWIMDNKEELLREEMCNAVLWTTKGMKTSWENYKFHK